MDRCIQKDNAYREQTITPMVRIPNFYECDCKKRFQTLHGNWKLEFWINWEWYFDLDFAIRQGQPLFEVSKNYMEGLLLLFDFIHLLCKVMTQTLIYYFAVFQFCLCQELTILRESEKKNNPKFIVQPWKSQNIEEAKNIRKIKSIQMFYNFTVSPAFSNGFHITSMWSKTL